MLPSEGLEIKDHRGFPFIKQKRIPGEFRLVFFTGYWKNEYFGF